MLGVARRPGLVVLLAASAGSLSAQAPAPLTPVGTWTVRTADNRCVLERTYGAVDRPTLMSMTPGTLGTAVILRVLQPRGAEGRIVRTDEGSVTVLSPNGAPRTVAARVRSYGPVAGTMRLTSAQVRGLSPFDLVTARTLVLDRGQAGPPIAIAPDGITGALTALDTCENDLLRRQGIDPGTPAEPSQPPEPVGGAAARWFHPSDYPTGVAGLMPFGHVVARLIVGADGAVGQCAVAEGSGNAALDAKTCDILLARGRYRPATDDAGRPVAAAVVVPVNWEPPRG